jgi:hypothetical protein
VGHQTVPLAHCAMHDFAGRGYFKALFDAAFGLQFRHFALLCWVHGLDF